METTGSQPEARAVSFVQGDVISHSMLVSRQWDPYLSAARAPSLRRAGVPSRVWASCWLRAGAVEWPRSHHGLSSFGGPLEKPGGHRTGGHPIFFSSKLRLGSKTLGAPAGFGHLDMGSTETQGLLRGGGDVGLGLP